jgi:hypothetical protein
MLHGVGVNWADLSPHLKNGIFIAPPGAMTARKMGYEDIRELVTPPISEV